MEFRFQKWSENGQCLPVNVVDDRGQEQQSADPPAQERYGAALDRRELVGKIHEKQLLAAANERKLTGQAPGIIDWFSNSLMNCSQRARSSLVLIPWDSRQSAMGEASTPF